MDNFFLVKNLSAGFQCNIVLKQFYIFKIINLYQWVKSTQNCIIDLKNLHVFILEANNLRKPIPLFLRYPQITAKHKQTTSRRLVLQKFLWSIRFRERNHSCFRRSQFITLQNLAKYSTHSGFRRLFVCLCVCLSVCLSYV